jgi:hypothetical protein
MVSLSNHGRSPFDRLRMSGLFAIIYVAVYNGGDKIDFWLLTDSAFDESRFARKIKISLFGTDTWISTPEDTILAKLLWAKKSGGSGKQLLDVQRVYEVNAPTIDRMYIEKWCAILGVRKYWNTIISDAKM